MLAVELFSRQPRVAARALSALRTIQKRCRLWRRKQTKKSPLRINSPPSMHPSCLVRNHYFVLHWIKTSVLRMTIQWVDNEHGFE